MGNAEYMGEQKRKEREALEEQKRLEREEKERKKLEEKERKRQEEEQKKATRKKEEEDSTVDNLPPPIPPHAKSASGNNSAQLSEMDSSQLGDIEHIIEGNSLEGPADLQRLDSLVTEFTSQFPPEPSESIVKS